MPSEGAQIRHVHQTLLSSLLLFREPHGKLITVYFYLCYREVLQLLRNFERPVQQFVKRYQSVEQDCLPAGKEVGPAAFPLPRRDPSVFLVR